MGDHILSKLARLPDLEFKVSMGAA